MSGTFQESGVEAIVKNLNGFLADVGKMDKAIQGVGSNTSAITDWNNKITSVTANVAKVVGAAAVGATAAFGAFVADATKQSANLESQLSGIAAVLNKGTEAIAPLKKLILDLGIDPALKVSASEAAQAVELLARNGLDMTEIIDGAARSTVLLANATGADFGTAADIATDAMAIFNIEAANMDDAVNGITGVTTSSKFSIDDYRLALAQAGGVAGAVGVPFDQFNATIAGIAPLFASGSDAGTSFKTFLQRLIPASGPARDAMRDLGLYTGLSRKEFEKAQSKVIDYKDELAKLDPTSKKYAERSAELTTKIQVLEESLVQGKNAFFDNNGQMKDMDQIAQILQDALSGLSEERKNEALSTIFGTDAMRAAVGVAELGAEGYENLGAKIAEIDAGNQAKTRMDNLAGSLEILNGIVETLRIRIGDKFNPVFRDLVDRVAGFLSTNADRIVDFFGKLADMTQTAIDKFVPLVSSWLPKLEEWVDNGSVSLGGMIDKVIEVTGGVVDFTNKVIGAITPVTKWIGENYTLEDILNGVLSVIVVSLIPAITSLVTTITPVIALFTTVAELSSRMTEGQKQFALAVGVAVFALPPLISAITTVTGVISGVISVGGSLVGLITGGGGVVAALGAILNPVGLVVAAVAGLGIAWATDFGGIRTKTIEVTSAVGQAISTWSSNTVTKFRETQTQIGTTLAQWSTNIGTTFSQMSANIGSTLANLSTSANTKISGFTSQAEQKFGTLRTNAQNAFGGMSSSIQSSASSLASSALEKLRRFQDDGTGIFTRFRENALFRVGELARDVPNRLRELVETGLRIFDVGRWVQAGADVIGGIMTGLARAATAPLRWIENFAGSLIRTFTSILKIASPSQVFDEYGVNIMEGLEYGLTDGGQSVLGYMSSFSTQLTNTISEAQQQAEKNFQALLDTAYEAYNGATTLAGGMGGSATEAIDEDAIAKANAKHAVAVYSVQYGVTDVDFSSMIEEAWSGSDIEAYIKKIAEMRQAEATAAPYTAFLHETDRQALTVNYAALNSIADLKGKIFELESVLSKIDTYLSNDNIAAGDRTQLGQLENIIRNDYLVKLNEMISELQADEDAKAQAAAAAAEAAAAEQAAAAAAAAAAQAQREAELRAAQQATTSFLGQAIQPIIDKISLIAEQGANLYFTDKQISEFDAGTAQVFDAVDQRLEGTVSYLLSTIQSDLTNLSSTSSISRISGVLQTVIDEVVSGIAGSGLQWVGANTLESDRQSTAFSGFYGLLQAALPVLAGSTTSVDTTVNTGDINNGMDVASLQALIEQAVAAALP